MTDMDDSGQDFRGGPKRKVPSDDEHLPGDISLGLQTAKKRKYCGKNADHTQCVLCKTQKSKTTSTYNPKVSRN